MDNRKPYNLYIIYLFCLDQYANFYVCGEDGTQDEYDIDQSGMHLVSDIDFEDNDLPIECGYGNDGWYSLEEIESFPYYDKLLKEKPLLRFI